MQGTFQAVKVTDRVYWVGALDWAIRDFHGYSTDHGSTYNAYLILGEKITLIDTVKASFVGELLARVASVVDPREIDYVISNHAEMDHSGALPQVIEAVQPEKVYASVMGAKALADHFHLEREIIPVGEGSTLNLGDLNLVFTETRMLHWPDSMFTYLVEEGVLFSSDAFGMHLASSERFADEVGGWELEAAKYFANILLPHAALVTKLLAKVEQLNLDLRVIAPDHGPIWRTDPGGIVDLYARWAERRPKNKAVVVYDTMWQSTARMARAYGEGLAAGGTRVKLLPLRATHRSDVVTELLDAGALVVGSPTLNNNLFPSVADFLAYLRGLRPVGLLGAAFGSYGWSGEAVNQVTEVLQAIKAEVVGEGLKVKYVPDEAALARCREAGEALGRTLAARTAKPAPVCE